MNDAVCEPPPHPNPPQLVSDDAPLVVVGRNLLCFGDDVSERDPGLGGVSLVAPGQVLHEALRTDGGFGARRGKNGHHHVRGGGVRDPGILGHVALDFGVAEVTVSAIHNHRNALGGGGTSAPQEKPDGTAMNPCDVVARVLRAFSDAAGYKRDRCLRQADKVLAGHLILAGIVP